MMAPEGRPQGRCMFEWTYFARPESCVEGRSVYLVRKALGAALAGREKERIDVAMPAPDSGRSAVAGYAERLRVPYIDGIYKSPYTPRTFQMPDPEERNENVNLKLSPIPEALKGRRVAYIDDSIVRSTTMRLVSRRLKKWAEEVHVRITTPPILSFCPLGIDMHTKGELAARRHMELAISSLEDSKLPPNIVDRVILAGSVEAAAGELGIDPDYLKGALEEANGRMVECIRGDIGVDSLSYTTIPELVEAINSVPVAAGAPPKLPYEKLCTGCLGGRYPLKRKVLEKLLRADRGEGRAWEQQPSARRVDKANG